MYHILQNNYVLPHTNKEYRSIRKNTYYDKVFIMWEINFLFMTKCVNALIKFRDLEEKDLVWKQYNNIFFFHHTIVSFNFIFCQFWKVTFLCRNSSFSHLYTSCIAIKLRSLILYSAHLFNCYSVLYISVIYHTM